MAAEVKSTEINGVPIAYREIGAGEPVLYLHGFPTSGYLWRHVMNSVGSSYRTIAPDFPGSGDSAMMNGPHTWEALVEFTDAFVEALEIAPVHLGVHDWGGLIGLAWACKNPHKVASLLISNTSFRSKDRWHGLAQQWRQPGVGEEQLGSITQDSFTALMSAFGGLTKDAIGEYFKGLNTPKRAAAKLEMYRSLEFEMLAPLEPILPEVAPGRVVVIWGAQDPMLPEKIAHRFGDRLGAEVHVLDEAGHFLQEDAGDDVGKRHLRFLQSKS